MSIMTFWKCIYKLKSKPKRVVIVTVKSMFVEVVNECWFEILFCALFDWVIYIHSQKLEFWYNY